MKLNPLIVAKVIGIFLIVVGSAGIISGLIGLDGKYGQINAQLAGLMPIKFIIQGLFAILIGYGLIKSKQWSIYGYGLILFINVIVQLLSGKSALRNIASDPSGIVTLVILGLEIYFLYLFYQNKKKFNK